jgi:hypothetical protein
MTQTPTVVQMPELGFYHFYLHDPNKSIFQHAYEVLEPLPEVTPAAAVRPLFVTPEYKRGQPRMLVQLETFLSEVEKDGTRVPRFAKISDPTVILQLERIRSIMYPPAACT